MGDAASRLRWRRLHGLSSQVKDSTDGRLINQPSDQLQSRLLGRPFATRGDFRVWQIVLQKSQNARRQIFRQGRNKRQSPIDVLSIASPRLPVSSSLVDVVP